MRGHPPQGGLGTARVAWGQAKGGGGSPGHSFEGVVARLNVFCPTGYVLIILEVVLGMLGYVWASLDTMPIIFFHGGAGLHGYLRVSSDNTATLFLLGWVFFFECVGDLTGFMLDFLFLRGAAGGNTRPPR